MPHTKSNSTGSSLVRRHLALIPGEMRSSLGAIQPNQLYNMDSIPFDLSRFLQKQLRAKDETSNPLKKIFATFDLTKRFCTLHLTVRADGYEEDDMRKTGTIMVRSDYKVTFADDGQMVIYFMTDYGETYFLRTGHTYNLGFG